MKSYLKRIRKNGTDIVYYYGNSKTKVEAGNANHEGESADIIVLLSDDMVTCFDAFDELIVSGMKEHFPNMDGAIKFNDLAYVPQQAITSSSNAVAWNSQSQSNAYHLTTENTTLSAPSNAVEGSFICIEVNFDGSHTFSWNAIFNFAADAAPTTTDTYAKTDILVFRYNGAIWQEVGRTLNIPES